jgi:small-conductance mechanosensitive channel
LPDFLYLTFYNNTVLKYLVFLLSLILSLAVIRIAARLAVKRLNLRAERTGLEVYGILAGGIKKYLAPVLYLTAVLLCMKTLVIGPALNKIINSVVLAFIAAIGAMFISSLAGFFVNRYWLKRTNDPNNRLVIKWISAIIKFLIWAIALFLFLENIGVRINSLVAGLGIGGLTIAFAAQTILGDIFCFFTIFFDRPFEIGDFIVAGEQSGTVEHIGVKTTRLRALSGEQLIFSNSDLTSSRIRNYKTMQQRRVLFTLSVTYDTSAEKLREIPGIIKSVVDSCGETSFGRAHFFSYGESGLDFEIAYYVLSSDYEKYMDIHQQINLRIKEEFDKREIKFALPSRTIYLKNSSAALTASESVKF